MNPENKDNKASEVEIEEGKVQTPPSPYKKGLEELFKLDIFEGIADADYVSNFQGDARTNVELQSSISPNPEKVLEKSMFEVNLGRFVDAAVDAREVSKMKPEMEEAHFNEGKTMLLVAMKKVGVITGSPTNAMDSVENLLRHARKCFAKAIELDPDDEEAKILFEKVGAILEGN